MLVSATTESSIASAPALRFRQTKFRKINLVHLAQQLISMKKEIIDKYGLAFYNQIKETIMQGQTHDSRQVLNRFLCKAMKSNNVKITVNAAQLSRLRW